LYTLKLTRIEGNGNVTDSTIRVTVDGTAPTIKLVQPFPNEGFVTPSDEWVDVNAQVQDDYTISRVEFYSSANSESPFVVKTVAPFNVKWTISGGGNVEFWAVAYDGAGNKTESGRVRVNISRAAP
jgi:hypothetical protein